MLPMHGRAPSAVTTVQTIFPLNSLQVTRMIIGSMTSTMPAARRDRGRVTVIEQKRVHLHRHADPVPPLLDDDAVIGRFAALPR